MTHKVTLDGWYETEGGLLPIYEEGTSLNEIVYRLQKDDEDFGHTDMDLELLLPNGDIKNVNSMVYRMVNDNL